MLPLSIAVRDALAADRTIPPPGAVIAEVATGAGMGVVFDAVYDSDFCRCSSRRSRAAGASAVPTGGARHSLRAASAEALADAGALDRARFHAASNNSSIVYGNRYIMKLFRKIERGLNPDLELGRFLNDVGFAHVPNAGRRAQYRVARTSRQLDARRPPGVGPPRSRGVDVHPRHAGPVLRERARRPA